MGPRHAAASAIEATSRRCGVPLISSSESAQLNEISDLLLATILPSSMPHPGECVMTMEDDGDGEDDEDSEEWRPVSRSMIVALVKLDGGLLASGSLHERIKVWNVGTGDCAMTLGDRETQVCALAKLDGGLLASGSKFGKVMVWNVCSGECVITIHGHRSGADVCALAQLDGGLLVSGCCSGRVNVWMP